MLVIRVKSYLSSTFSIVACDPQANELGIAAQSKFFAVGANVPWIEPDVGAIVTQAWADVHYGRDGLALLRQGQDVRSVLDSLLGIDTGREKRQIGMVSAIGEAAAFTGKECPKHAAHIVEKHCSCQGNLLVSPKVVEAMAKAFLDMEGPLSQRLLEALKAAQKQGGDKRGEQSAVLLVVKNAVGPDKDESGLHSRIDLRVDDHPRPITELERLSKLYCLYFEEPAKDDLIRLDPELTLKVQHLLHRLGYYDGHLTGRFEAGTREALHRFLLQENLAGRVRGDAFIDLRVVEFMEALLVRRER